MLFWQRKLIIPLGKSLPMQKIPESLFRVTREGHVDCPHPYVFYIDNGISGQSLECDVTDCHMQMELLPDHANQMTYKMPFPSHSWIRTPNPQYGGEDFYAWQADADGIVTENLPESQWISREGLDLSLESAIKNRNKKI